MTKANDSITITPGAGASVATQTVGGVEHQVVMLADAAGQLIDDPTDVYLASNVAMSKSGGRVYLTIYNNDAALVVDVLGIWIAQETTAAVTGLIRGYRLYRTTAVAPTAGTSNGWLRLDNSSAALDADIVVRTNNVSVASLGDPITAVGLAEEETGAGGSNKVWLWNWQEMGLPIVLREDEGLMVQQDATAGTGLLSAGIFFRVRS